ncbi:MAG: hypothetical protein M3O71_15665 [Bacteroidota bacterium]|nr:hypothetical protein [Bacteroidota bacterium]
MRTDNLFTALILMTFCLLVLYLLMLSISSSWKRKYFPTGAITTAHAIALGGQYLAAAALVTATLFPLKDYLYLVSATGHLTLSSGPLWGLLLICALTAGTGYLIATYLSKILAGSLFKGKSAAIEFQENNTGYSLVCAVTTIACSMIFVLPVIVLIQGFIPMPAIPNIR